MRTTPTGRLMILATAGLSLLTGLDAALLLIGVWAPVDGPAAAHLPGRHGILMVLGFLGTLIALERAVALRQPWGYAAPLCLGTGGIALAGGAPAPFGAVLLVDGVVLLLIVYAALYRRRGDTTVAVEALGALSALVAALLWLRLDVATLLPWLVTFIVATIAAERVELARLHLPRRSEDIVLGLIIALVCAATATLLMPDVGARSFGAVLLVLVGWLGPHDVARRTIRSEGLPRYSAAAMLLGYGWLAVAGAAWVVVGRPSDVAAYDITVHATFLGFAMSMVLAHAPIILPAIVRRPLPYHPFLWAPLALLHGGLLIRVTGDVAAHTPLWQAGSVVTVLALLCLPICMITIAVLAGQRSAPGSRAKSAAPAGARTLDTAESSPR